MLATFKKLWRGLTGRENCSKGFHYWDKGTELYGNTIYQCKHCEAHYITHGSKK